MLDASQKSTTQGKQSKEGHSYLVSVMESYEFDNENNASIDRKYDHVPNYEEFLLDALKEKPKNLASMILSGHYQNDSKFCKEVSNAADKLYDEASESNIQIFRQLIIDGKVEDYMDETICYKDEACDYIWRVTDLNNL